VSTATGGLAKEHVVPVLGYIPQVQYLKKGWICFHCNSTDDASFLLSKLWVYGGSSLMLKRWRLAFNPDTEYFQHRHIWVLLPDLPLHLWNDAALTEIGNSLGTFIALDPQQFNGPWRKMGRVLVAMDITTGLPETLEIFGEGKNSSKNWITLDSPSVATTVGKQDTSAAIVRVSLLLIPPTKVIFYKTLLNTWRLTQHWPI
jgi:hypothetical protein